jgi:hypothetical protein
LGEILGHNYWYMLGVGQKIKPVGSSAGLLELAPHEALHLLVRSTARDTFQQVPGVAVQTRISDLGIGVRVLRSEGGYSFVGKLLRGIGLGPNPLAGEFLIAGSPLSGRTEDGFTITTPGVKGGMFTLGDSPADFQVVLSSLLLGVRSGLQRGYLTQSLGPTEQIIPASTSCAADSSKLRLARALAGCFLGTGGLGDSENLKLLVISQEQNKEDEKIVVAVAKLGDHPDRPIKKVVQIEIRPGRQAEYDLLIEAADGSETRLAAQDFNQILLVSRGLLAGTVAAWSKPLNTRGLPDYLRATANTGWIKVE